MYGTSLGVTITQVAFYLDSNNDGVLQPTTDKFLGNGTPSTIPNASHNSLLTISTTGMAPGTYRIFAQAKDSNGLFSDPFAVTFTIA